MHFALIRSLLFLLKSVVWSCFFIYYANNCLMLSIWQRNAQLWKYWLVLSNKPLFPRAGGSVTLKSIWLSLPMMFLYRSDNHRNAPCSKSFWCLRQAFFPTAPKKLKDEITQNSRKKLKTQAKNSRIRQILALITAKINGNDQKTRGKLLKYQNQGQNIQNITEWVQF